MKIIRCYLSVCLCICLLQSCKTSTTIVSEETIQTPCNCNSNQSNGVICFSSVGESKDQMYAKQKALSDGRAGLASLVQSEIKILSDKFTNSKDSNKGEELEKKRSEATRQIVNQTLSNITITCEETRVTKSETYKTYLRLEIDKNEVIKTMEKHSFFKGISTSL